MSIVTRIKKALEDTNSALGNIVFINDDIRTTLYEVLGKLCESNVIDDTGTISVSPGAQENILNEVGYFGFRRIYLYLNGVDASYIKFLGEYDYYEDAFLPFTASPHFLKQYGITSAGIHNFGSCSIFIIQWNDSSFVYEYYVFLNNPQITQEVNFYLINGDSANTLNARVNIAYFERLCTKRIFVLLHDKPKQIRDVFHAIRDKYKNINLTYCIHKGKYLIKASMRDEIYEKHAKDVIEMLKKGGVKIEKVLWTRKEFLKLLR